MSKIHFDLMAEEEELMPWLVLITTTDLPRHLNHDDQIIIEGDSVDPIIYTVSKVAPK